MNKMINILIGLLLLMGSIFVGIELGKNFFPETEIRIVELEKPVIVEKNNTVIKEIEVPVIVEKNNTIEVPVNVTKYVYVDNENLNMILEFVNKFYQDSDYEVFFEDKSEIVDKVKFFNEFNDKSLVELKLEYKEILEDEDVFENELEYYRQSEVSVREISEPILVSVDFDDNDMLLNYEIEVRAKRSGYPSEYFSYDFEVLIENKEIKEINLI